MSAFEDDIFELLNADFDLIEWGDDDLILPSVSQTGLDVASTAALSSTSSASGSSEGANCETVQPTSAPAPPPRILRRDVRRKYANIFCTVLNSCDEDMLRAFLKKFCSPRLSLRYTCPNGNRALFPPSFELHGPRAVFHYFSGQFQQFPDFSVVLNKVQVKTSSEWAGRSKVICSLHSEGLKMFQMSIDEWLPEMTATNLIQTMPAAVEEMSEPVRKYTQQLLMDKGSDQQLSSEPQQRISRKRKTPLGNTNVRHQVPAFDRFDNGYSISKTNANNGPSSVAVVIGSAADNNHYESDLHGSEDAIATAEQDDAEDGIRDLPPLACTRTLLQSPTFFKMSTTLTFLLDRNDRIDAFDFYTILGQ